ncbi:alginate lyase family protein [Uliginosibacterium gangwonense]|uniref:alginate lyase family protein n=1 Tax=Uliginosibacterium gangwonense TaxID=392736 RepID=UPI000373CFA3|nr:alginate lyase family protein [Uliginosibacterium gangwonense]
MRSALVAILLGLSLQAQAFNCPPSSPGLQDIKAFGYYTDAANSVRDDAKFKETHALTKPFEDFASQVSKLSDLYLEKDEPEAAACTITWLERWAKDRAMLGQMVRVNNDQSEYVRTWTNASAAISWNKVREQASAEQRQVIDAWLKEVSWATLGYWSAHPKSKRNNHYYWTGVGVMATAVATTDADLLKEARHIYETGLGEIQDDGELPMEMQRGIRALHYHNFAAMPLVMIAEMARKTGQDWFALREGRLDRLVARVVTGLREPAWFEHAAGVGPQVIPAQADLCWIPLYRARREQDGSFEGISVSGGLFQRDLGGTLSLMMAHGVFDPR